MTEAFKVKGTRRADVHAVFLDRPRAEQYAANTYGEVIELVDRAELVRAHADLQRLRRALAALLAEPKPQRWAEIARDLDELLPPCACVSSCCGGPVDGVTAAGWRCRLGMTPEDLEGVLALVIVEDPAR